MHSVINHLSAKPSVQLLVQPLVRHSLSRINKTNHKDKERIKKVREVITSIHEKYLEQIGGKDVLTCGVNLKAQRKHAKAVWATAMDALHHHSQPLPEIWDNYVRGLGENHANPYSATTSRSINDTRPCDRLDNYLNNGFLKLVQRERGKLGSELG